MGRAAADDVIYVVGHKHPDTDSICAAIGYAWLKQSLGDRRVRAARAGACNAETHWTLKRFGLPEPELLTRATGLKLILVDHNEVAQALDDIAGATVLEVWEHHRIGDLTIPQPIVFHCEPLGATATLIGEQFQLHNVDLPPSIAGALLAGILSDTLVLTSPTTADKDRQMARRLAGVAGLDVDHFGRELMAARGSLADQSVADMVESDFKEFHFAGHAVGIAQVESPDLASLFERQAAVIEELRRVRTARGLAQVILMATDVGRRGSYLWCVGEHCEVLEQALGQPLGASGTWQEGWMSRKKQLVPALQRAFAQQ